MLIKDEALRTAVAQALRVKEDEITYKYLVKK